MERRCGPADVSRCQLMSRFGEKLGRKQEAAVLALLSTRNVEEVARAVGVTSRTLFRWMKEPEFDAVYREAKRADFGQSIARLHHLCSAAVSTLGKVMLDSATPPATKVRAADSILNHTIKAIEIEDIEARVSELERAADPSKRK
jgi:transposase-like protein